MCGFVGSSVRVETYVWLEAFVVLHVVVVHLKTLFTILSSLFCLVSSEYLLDNVLFHFSHMYFHMVWGYIWLDIGLACLEDDLKVEL